MSQETSSDSNVVDHEVGHSFKQDNLQNPNNVSVGTGDNFDNIIANLRGIVEQSAHDNNVITSIQSDVNERADLVDGAIQYISDVERAKSPSLSESQKKKLNEDNDRLLMALTPEFQDLLNKYKTAPENSDHIIESLMGKKIQLAKAKEVIREVMDAAAKNQEVNKKSQKRKRAKPQVPVPEPDLIVKDFLKQPSEKDDQLDKNVEGGSSEVAESSYPVSNPKDMSEKTKSSELGKASSAVDPGETLNQLQTEVAVALTQISKILEPESRFANLTEAVESMGHRFLQETEKNTSLSGELQLVKKDLKKTVKGKANNIKKWKRKLEEVKQENEKCLLNPSDVSDASFSSIDRLASDSASADALKCPSDNWKVRYDELCSKLETSEKSLEIQQEMNAKITAQAAETRQKHSSEISVLKEKIQKMTADAAHHQEELDQIRLLEETKRAVLVDMIEEEKQTLRDNYDSIINDYKSGIKKLENQKAESKKRLENENWKRKKSAKAAEKRRNSSSNESKHAETNTNGNDVHKVIADLSKLQVLVNDRSSDNIAEVNKLLGVSIKSVTEMTSNLEKLQISLKDLHSNQELSDQALKAFTETNEKMIEEHDAALRAEKEKFEALQRMIEETMEKEDISAKRWKDLDEQEKLLQEKSKRLEQEKEELAKREKRWHEIKTTLVQHTVDLKKERDQSRLDCEELTEENRKLRESLAIVTKQQQGSPTPKNDRSAQLESRLITIQSSAKAQQQRLEDELAVTRKERDQISIKNDEFVLLNKQLHQKSLAAEELCSSLSQKMEENVKSISDLRKTISVLEDENKSLMFVNGEERAGLVNELVATKEKLKECQNAASIQAVKSDEIESLEDQLKIAKFNLEEMRKAASQPSDQAAMEFLSPSNGMFPDLDPLLRQLVHILAGNQNYMYGVLGFVVYILLIHLYILL